MRSEGRAVSGGGVGVGRPPPPPPPPGARTVPRSRDIFSRLNAEMPTGDGNASPSDATAMHALTRDDVASDATTLTRAGPAGAAGTGTGGAAGASSVIRIRIANSRSVSRTERRCAGMRVGSRARGCTHTASPHTRTHAGTGRPAPSESASAAMCPSTRRRCASHSQSDSISSRCGVARGGGAPDAPPDAPLDASRDVARRSSTTIWVRSLVGARGGGGGTAAGRGGAGGWPRGGAAGDGAEGGGRDPDGLKHQQRVR